MEPLSTHSGTFQRHEWKGIGVEATVIVEGGNELSGAFLAVANDRSDGQPAVSVWTDASGWGHLEAAIWMTPDGARSLALSLMALAERAEAGSWCP